MSKQLIKKLIIVVSIVLTVIILFGVIKVQNIVLKKIYKTDYSEYVYKYSEENGIDPYLTFAIIKAESNFNKTVISKSGAVGLMQLMESTAEEQGEKIGEEVSVKEALYNPERNIMIGTSYFAYLLERYEDNYLLALAAYNAGIGNVDSWIENGIIREDGKNIENIPYKETNNYVRKVVRDYKIYKDVWSTIRDEVK